LGTSNKLQIEKEQEEIRAGYKMRKFSWKCFLLFR